MRIIKTILTVLFCIILIAILVAPVGILYYISEDEQAQYQPDFIPAVEEMAYGEIVDIRRRDMSETITLSGSVVSVSDFFVELEVKDPYALRFMVSVGDVIHPGDLSAYNGSKEILSEVYGMIREINLGTDSYLRMASLDDLALECYVNQSQRKVLLRSSLELADEDGTTLSFLSADDVYSGDNTTRVLLRYDKEDLCYGQSFENLKLTTGRVYRDALVVEERCVYQKVGAEGYYLRLVDEDGKYLSETEVKLGYSDGTYICVSGVDEGMLCDSGYKAFVGE